VRTLLSAHNLSDSNFPEAALGILQTTSLAFGFLAGVLVLGRLVVPPLVRWVGRVDLPGTATMLAVMVAFGLA
jgi:Na+:H+ antiporter